MQEEIKIISVEVYVNPYAELDEEEEKTNDDNKTEDADNVSIILFFSLSMTSILLVLLDLLILSVYLFSLPVFQEKVGSWYSNPGTGTSEIQAVGSGIGKYLKARAAQADSKTYSDSSLPPISVVKKRKTGSSTAELKDFSAW